MTLPRTCAYRFHGGPVVYFRARRRQRGPFGAGVATALGEQRDEPPVRSHPDLSFEPVQQVLPPLGEVAEARRRRLPHGREILVVERPFGIGGGVAGGQEQRVPLP